MKPKGKDAGEKMERGKMRSIKEKPKGDVGGVRKI